MCRAESKVPEKCRKITRRSTTAITANTMVQLYVYIRILRRMAEHCPSPQSYNVITCGLSEATEQMDFWSVHEHRAWTLSHEFFVVFVGLSVHCLSHRPRPQTKRTKQTGQPFEMSKVKFTYRASRTYCYFV